MKTLYFECHNGAAGDMILASLYALCPDQEKALECLNGMGLSHHGVHFAPTPVTDHCVTGIHMHVVVDGHEEGHDHDHHHSHQSLGDIYEVLDGLHSSDWVKTQAKAVYESIAAAESAVHGEPVNHVHFHEVGALDAVADVAGVCCLLEHLAPARIVCSPVAVGSGQVRCAHGILPVPAPATARLLEGIAITSGRCEGELCTPTGAALLRQFAAEFGPMPPMVLEKVGAGFGTKHFAQALNAVRAFWGDAFGPEAAQVTELACNLDDMSGEDIAFCVERLLDGGALDAWTAGIHMKKGRPGVLLSCLCRPQDVQIMTQLMLRHTTTLGVRETQHRRTCLTRRQELLLTQHGPVQVKIASGHGITRQKPEFEDIATIAKKEGLSLEQVRQQVWKV